jgi:hypothetical protein
VTIDVTPGAEPTLGGAGGGGERTSAAVSPEVEPFFHVGFTVIGPQGFIVRGWGNCGLVMAGAATAGAGHDFRRLGVG